MAQSVEQQIENNRLRLLAERIADEGIVEYGGLEYEGLMLARSKVEVSPDDIKAVLTYALTHRKDAPVAQSNIVIRRTLGPTSAMRLAVADIFSSLLPFGSIDLKGEAHTHRFHALVENASLSGPGTVAIDDAAEKLARQVIDIFGPDTRYHGHNEQHGRHLVGGVGSSWWLASPHQAFRVVCQYNIHADSWTLRVDLFVSKAGEP